METMWLTTSIVWLIVLAIVLLVANLVLTFLIFIRRAGGPTDQQGPPPPPPQPPPDIEETPQGQGLRGKLEAVINLLIRQKTFTTEEINQEIQRIRGK